MTGAIVTPKLAKGNVVSLQSLGINEAYLEKFIDADPTVLGLGDVFVVERQRRHEKAGRLDLLLQDVSGEIRYEVELMLGSADESHLIRTVEYWDIERRRYPAYDHRADQETGATAAHLRADKAGWFAEAPHPGEDRPLGCEDSRICRD